MGGISTAGMAVLGLPDPLAGSPHRIGERCPTLYDLRWQEDPGVERLSCCALNGPRGLALLSQWALMRSADGVIVNYYGPGEMRATTPARRDVLLKQDTDYPIGGSLRLTVTPEMPERFTLRLRIPAWSNPTQVTVNGQPAGPAQPGSYLALDRQWSPGDVITLELNMTPRMVPGGQRPPFARTDGQAVGRMVIYHGPLLMAYDSRFDRYDPSALPAIDLNGAASRVPAAVGAWEPLLLLRFPTLDGRTLTLCDFASAGILPWIPSRRWQLSRRDGSILAAELTLLPNGTIQGSTHPNESRWGFEGTDVTFYGADGTATTRFATISARKDRTRLEGKFLLDPTITHVLRQLDGDLTDTIWDFVRIDGASSPSAISASPIRLEPYGRIHGYQHPTFPNEAHWERDGDTLVFCNHEGRPTTRFTTSRRVGEQRELEGLFAFNPQITHRLQELDLGWVRGSHYVSWLPTPAPGPVTALSTVSGGTSLYVLGFDGQVWSRFFPDPVRQGEWSAWFPLGPNVFPAGSPVTALSTLPGGTSLYVLGFDEHVWSRFFPDAARPDHWSAWFPLGPNVFCTSSPVTALSTLPGGTSLYVLGFDGQVWTRFFPDPMRQGEWSSWFPLGPNLFPGGSPVTALSTIPGGTSLYVIGFDGQVWSRFFPDPVQSGQWSPWFPLGPNVFPAGSPVAALSTGAGTTSLYVVGFDGQIWSRFFPGPRPGQWSDWFPLGSPHRP